ncbi:hypothetical protein AVEN_210250-1 [Araneus ventricosus]|uniref:DUF4817 domain-containing protein n=1 Tax=Araneus ventricosus TaxID=182803 RepID=A0A4Y2FYE8_ARAVE|nr:hypothetical protein AVEN_210250-1 [Araneus ventricosus]
MAARLYRECLPEGQHPTRQAILKVVKSLRETGCATTRPQVRRPRDLGRKVQSEDVLAYALGHPQSSTKMISENCGLSKSHVWAIRCSSIPWRQQSPEKDQQSSSSIRQLLLTYAIKGTGSQI